MNENIRVIENHHGTPAKKLRLAVEGDESQRIVIRKCSHVIIENLAVNGYQPEGDILSGKHYAITLEDCHHCQLDNPEISGTPDESSKERFADTVSNGILIGPSCADIELDDPEVEFVHVGICARGENTKINGGEIWFVSGDHVQLLANGCELTGARLKWSIPCLPYDQWHVDLVQLYDTQFDAKSRNPSRLKNISITDNTLKTWANKLAHPWAVDGQAVLFSDGVGDGIEVSGNQITVNHEIAILLNPCDNSCIENNKIITISPECKPFIGFDDRKHYGIATKNTRESNNTIRLKAGIDQKYRLPDEMPAPPGNLFEREVENIKTLDAIAVTEADYQAAAHRLGISTRMIKAIAAVESRGFGYNNDGSTKSLFERHILWRECVSAGIDVKAAQKQLGSDLINKKTGGYKGGIAEYWRMKQAYQGLTPDAHRSDATAPTEAQALELVLQSASFGEFQIMGFNAEMVGYPSALAMCQAFHQSAVEQLNAFCAFIERSGGAEPLREADKLMAAGQNASKPLDAFARTYNGKAHKGYDIKVAAEYRRLSPDAIEFKPKRKSRILQGGAASVAGLAIGEGGIAYITDKISGISEKSQDAIKTVEVIRDAANQIKDQAAELTAGVSDMKDQVIAVKDQATEVISANADMLGAINDLRWLLYALGGVLLLSLLGNLYAIYARLDDRKNGRN